MSHYHRAVHDDGPSVDAAVAAVVAAAALVVGFVAGVVLLGGGGGPPASDAVAAVPTVTVTVTAGAAPVAAPAPAQTTLPAADPELEVVDGDRLAADLRDAGLDVPGDALSSGYRWTDSTGSQALVLSEEGDGTLHAVLAASPDGDPRELRSLVEPGVPCDLDRVDEFEPASVSVGDVDGDGLAEVTVGWAVGCRGGVDPVGVKLALLEGEDKYILRGSGFLSALERQASGLGGGATSTPDPVGSAWPAGALDVAGAAFRRTFS